MREDWSGNGVSITLDARGVDTYTKISVPVTYGRHSLIETPEAVFQFNRNHEITRARGKGPDWIHPSEWLKRTPGNDWVYYSSGGYTGVFEAIGEYYLPNLPYPTNALIGGKPLDTPPVQRITRHWQDSIRKIQPEVRHAPSAIRYFVDEVLAHDPACLTRRAEQLATICEGRVTVLPPDARHVDYNILPLVISRGCRYHCRFCRVKTDTPFAMCTPGDIRDKIRALKIFYGRDLVNYNALFLGQHDALNGDADPVVDAVYTAFEDLDLARSYMKQPRIFLFGSVDSLLSAPDRLFKALDRLGAETFINIGLESADPETLAVLGKPVTRSRVIRAFDRMMDINAEYFHIEVTANFVVDDTLPAGHIPALLELVRDRPERPRPKGTIYLSPLRIGRPSRSALYRFNELKRLSRLPTFLYIIQRL